MLSIVTLLGLAVTLISCIPVIALLRTHPRGLTILFFAEMWERFSYYGMRGLLIFYLTQHLLFDDSTAAAQYGAYTSLVYLLPLIGGYLADRYLGARKAIAFGALLLVAGHFAMTLEGPRANQVLHVADVSYQIETEGRAEQRQATVRIGDDSYALSAAPGGGLAIAGLPPSAALPEILQPDEYSIEVRRDPLSTNIFFLALSLIIVGVGFLKPNISSLVGRLYSQNDPRRDGGFTLYYYGINLGSFWAAILCGSLGQAVGWWAGFGLAGIGMLAGYVVFVRGRRHLEGHGEPPRPQWLAQRSLGLTREHLIYAAAILGVGAIWVLVRRFDIVGWFLGAGSVAVLSYLGWTMATKCDRVARDRMALTLLLIAGAVVFFTLFDQAGTSLNLFASRNLQLPDAGFWTVTASQTQSFNAGFILLLAPAFASMWAALGRRFQDPDPMLKFGLGLVQVGAGFLVLAWGASFADADYKVPLIFLALTYLLHTTGELCLSPVGLSEVTKLSPPLIVSTLMATWFLATSWGQWIGGLIAQTAGSQTVGGQVLDPSHSLATSMATFQIIGWVGVGFGIVFLGLSPFLKYLAHVREGVGEAQTNGVVSVGETKAIS